MGFNLSDYEPVEDRLRRFWDDHPAGRVLTSIEHGDDWFIVRAEVYTDREDARPATTGYAREVVTQRGVNSTSALENGETSAIGRALANLNYAPKGARPSREEMSKPRAVDLGEFMADMDGLGDITDLDVLRALYADAMTLGRESDAAAIQARATAVKA